MILNRFRENDAPVLIVMGQSNAHGHGTRLETKKEAELQCAHVYGLAACSNQSYDIQDVVWQPFVMHGMNLGERQDYTCCLGGEFARMWEDTVRQGAALPALYVIQISIGGQGIDEQEKDGQNMWWMEREPVLVPGELQSVNISLYQLAIRVLNLAMKNLKKQGKRPVILGMHWNQWETEVASGCEVVNRAEQNLQKLFQGFYDALGGICNTYLYQPLSRVYENEPLRMQMKQLFEHMVEKQEHFRLVDLMESPLWRSWRQDKGVFQADLVHYTAEAQRWFASYQYEEVFKRDVLVLGDSITADGRYINYVNEYFEKYHKKEQIRFWNEGCSSENISGLTETIHPGPRPCIFDRIEQILENTTARSVLLCYGMNDGIYHPFCEDKFVLYKTGIRKLVSILDARGMKVTLMTPPPFDPLSFVGELRDKNADDFGYLTPYQEYDDVLQVYADWILEEYGQRGYTVIDLHEKLKQQRKEKRMEDMNYKSGDGIHPNEDGHREIARAILDAMYHIPLTWVLQDKEQYHAEWSGFDTDYFVWSGYEVTVAKPHIAARHGGWIYRTEFFGAFPQTDVEMLKRGYYVASLKISNRYGDSGAVERMEKFRRMIVARYQVTEKPILFGFSRGGLYAVQYAASYGQYVHKIYLDAPVVDVFSWPATYKDGKSLEWQECRRVWKLPSHPAVFQHIVEQALLRLTDLRIPLILVYGKRDDLVPYEENGIQIEEHYSRTTVPYKIIMKPECGHHPHSLEDPREIVEFLIS